MTNFQQTQKTFKLQSRKTYVPETASTQDNVTIGGGRSYTPDEILQLQRTIGNRAVSRLVTPSIQRVAYDPQGTKLSTQSPAFDNLDSTQQQRLTQIDTDTKVTVFDDDSAFQNYVLNGNTTNMNALNIDENTYMAGIDQAMPIAVRREKLAPMKARTNKGMVMVEDNDGFNKLPPAQLPQMPPDAWQYKSQKHQNKYKIRNTRGKQRKPYELVLYQQNSTSRPAYNFRTDGDLVQTLFQTGEGFNPNIRFMAGLDGKGAKPKWNTNTDPNTTLKRGGPTRKYNKMKPKVTMVQGHGQDFDRTLPFVGEYNQTQNQAQKNLIPATTNPYTQNTKEQSDDHPANFSTEHPIYGEQIRNYLLGRTDKQYTGGAILEQTSYFDHRLNVPVPSGMNQPAIPKDKNITLFDTNNQPQESYRFPQFNATANNGHFTSEDYSQAVSKKFKGEKYYNLDNVLDEYETDLNNQPFTNPSYVDENITSGINDPQTQLTDDQQTQSALQNVGKPFMFLKDKDFQ